MLGCQSLSFREVRFNPVLAFLHVSCFFLICRCPSQDPIPRSVMAVGTQSWDLSPWELSKLRGGDTPECTQFTSKGTECIE